LPEMDNLCLQFSEHGFKWFVSKRIEYFADREARRTYVLVGSAVIDGQFIAAHHVAIGKHHMAEKPAGLIGGRGLHDGMAAPTQYDRRVFQVQQQCAKAIPVIGVGTMVDGQPALLGADRGCTGTHPLAIPITSPRTGNELVVSPMDAIVRTGEPDVVAAEFDTAGAMEGIVLAADACFEQGAVFIMGWQDQPVRPEFLPVRGGSQRHGYAVWRYSREGKVIGSVQ